MTGRPRTQLVVDLGSQHGVQLRNMIKREADLRGKTVSAYVRDVLTAAIRHEDPQLEPLEHRVKRLEDRLKGIVP